ncbi:MAG TPA: 50S ribosomal protein L9, partial [Deltaproteobacteria bacterium]|nr:50S ribosomal protein L9 [Deltaproteobacteria bacterium]
ALGDAIEVKSGYGRNYLLPQGMALLATGKASKELRHRLQYLEKLRAGKIALANEQAEKLN